MESHLEARLWNDVFKAAQDALKIPQGTIRATVLIETLPAAFEMEEILYELKDHASGLNAGRWDYMFSFIKKFRNRKDKVLPDRVQVAMTVPFMRAYTELLVKSCHTHGAHAMGGMSPFIPSRKDPEVNEKALSEGARGQAARGERRLSTGLGWLTRTWCRWPWKYSTRSSATRPHQKERSRAEVRVTAAELVDPTIPGGKITEGGFRLNVDVALQYINSWLLENGAAAIHNLMEDAATAEISRAQLWQWIRHGAVLDDGRPATRALYETIRSEELAKLGGAATGRYKDAAALLDKWSSPRSFPTSSPCPRTRCSTSQRRAIPVSYPSAVSPVTPTPSQPVSAWVVGQLASIVGRSTCCMTPARCAPTPATRWPPLPSSRVWWCFPAPPRRSRKW